MKPLNRVGLLLLALIAVGLLLLGPTSKGVAQPGGGAPKVLEWDLMIGVQPPFTGAANPINEVPGGGAPWVLEEGSGELRADGSIEVRVRGLVLERTGTNPVTAFRAVVSCVSTDADGLPIIVNVATDPFPADANGDADIEDQVDLPDPCIAPIVFVTNPTGSWFAATGF
jgi:hypothetical protein